ncbi:MAG: beta-propeller domain-containing protein, partial [Archangium sp.]|nr:beta-propeller domain-containing protein [Archangium sp.]
MGLGSVGLGTGCSNSTIPEPSEVQKKVALTAFHGANACTDLETYLEDTAVLQMRTQLESQRDGVPSWGWWGGFFGGAELDARASAPTANAGASQAAAPTNFTTTNNQVAGVDEADFVKNDGTRIFVLSGQKLHAARSWPAADTRVLGTLEIEGYPREMFLRGTSEAVVFSSIYRWYALSHAAGERCLGLDCGYYNANTVKVSVVDVSDMANLRVTHEYYLPGLYTSARLVGDSVRLVMNDGFHFPDGVRWYPEYTPTLWNNAAQLRASYDALIVENERLIRQQTLAGWAPEGRAVINGVETALPQDCTSFSRVNAPTRLGTVSVVTLNLANAGSLDRTSILAEPGEVYASAENLYIATRHWWWWPRPGQRDTTYLHQFDISHPDGAVYAGSGAVDGHIVDQFSMDEWQGHFRVATTIQTRVPDTANPQNTWGRMETTNRVSVLRNVNGSLDVVGQSADLAQGERIMSSRFIEGKGFVVTFRQVDPLFTFDLTDPTNVRKLGELKIPGFSTYLHPIDADHLLTIGTYVPETGNDWRARALQLAIFDVSDLANPRQTFTQLVGNAYGWSEAQNEHKAFNYFPAKKLLAIPFASWESSWDTGNTGGYWSSFTSDLRVFDVDVTTGFTPRGAVSMRDLYQVQNSGNWSYYWTPAVRRSVMA